MTAKRNRRSRGKRRARAFRAHLADPRHVLDAFKLYAAAMGPRVERGELDADGLFAEFRAILDRLVGEGEAAIFTMEADTLEAEHAVHAELDAIVRDKRPLADPEPAG